jgi:hypothetical protein
MVVFLLSLFACTTLSTVNGAKTIEPKTWKTGLGASLQNNNPLSTAIGIPVPQIEILVRYGLRENLDMGTRIYIGGLLFDLRYQFWQQGDWIFAIDPSIGGLYSPIGGVADIRMPIIAQKDLNEKWSFATGLTPISQNTYVFFPGMRENMKHNSMGTFVRMEKTGRTFTWGFSTDIYERTDLGIMPSINFGIDLSRN